MSATLTYDITVPVTSPDMGLNTATDTASSVKSLLFLSWGKWVPIKKPQGVCELLWAITCSFSWPPPQLGLVPLSQGWGWYVCCTWSNIPHSNRCWCDSLGSGWILHGTCAPLSLAVNFWLPSSQWQLNLRWQSKMKRNLEGVFHHRRILQVKYLWKTLPSKFLC